MGIKIIKKSITQFDTDAVVNAANEWLQQGGGVCHYIFTDCGYPKELQEECNKYGYCPVGSAVITGSYDLLCKYIIHGVGPRWSGGHLGEKEKLYSVYMSCLNLAKENNLKSITFPLISAGIFGYPLKEAWKVAINTCENFLKENDMDIYFAVLDDEIMSVGLDLID